MNTEIPSSETGLLPSRPGKNNPGLWRELWGDKTFFVSLLHLAVPIALQNLLINSLSFADTLMIGRLGETSIAAVGLGNQVFFLYSLFLFGIGSGSGIFVAQFWGKKDIVNIRKTQGICLSLCFFIGIVFSLLSGLMPERLLGVFSRDPEVIRLGSIYLRIVAPGYLFTSVNFSYSIVLRNVEKPRLPLICTAISLGCNIILNYLLIFGIGPFPTLGVAGAAWGTVISRAVEITAMLLFVYRPWRSSSPLPPAAKPRELFSYTGKFLFRYFTIALPVILNEIVWGTGMTMFKVVYGRVGTDALATMNISETVTNLFFILFLGSGNAAAAMIGKTIGQGEKEKTYRYGRRFLILSPLIGLGVGAVIALISNVVVRLFNVGPQVSLDAGAAMRNFALFLPAKAVNMHLIVGIFRSGGDTKFGLLYDVLGLWCIAIPLAFMAGLWWRLPVPWIYFLSLTEEFFKLFLGIPRFLSKKWINDVTGN
ncbi:MAG: MATE family efflux transporter [Spirochaetales bacterium]|jgi:putative MATE family efflux protein|nr:MATE family efflux transporter [Spirochaetales bacterium]